MKPVKSGYTIAIKQTSSTGKIYWSLTKIANDGPLMYSRKSRFIESLMTHMPTTIMERLLKAPSYDVLKDNIKIVFLQPNRTEEFGIAVRNYNIVTFIKKNENLIKSRYADHPLYQFAQSQSEKTQK